LNDWQTYHEWIEQRLNTGLTVLDVGCGRGTIDPFPWPKYPAVRLVGIDADMSASANPYLTEFRVLDEPDADWPQAENSVDLVLCRYVLEHVGDPDRFFKNLRRVMKPEGRFLFLTPNRRHPAAVVSRFLPVSVKRKVLKHLTGVDEDDVFATYYRMNNRGAMACLARRWGFAVERLVVREFEPCRYFQRFGAGRAAARFYFHLVSASSLDRFVGASMLGELRKL